MNDFAFVNFILMSFYISQLIVKTLWLVLCHCNVSERRPEDAAVSQRPWGRRSRLRDRQSSAPECFGQSLHMHLLYGLFLPLKFSTSQFKLLYFLMNKWLESNFKYKYFIYKLSYNVHLMFSQGEYSGQSVIKGWFPSRF